MITDEMIARAKECPIERLYPGELQPAGGKYSHRGVCPFHSETVGSFYIFKDNNFRCFGCQQHGDAISFYMKLNNVKFKDAVRAITPDI